MREYSGRSGVLSKKQPHDMPCSRIVRAGLLVILASFFMLPRVAQAANALKNAVYFQERAIAAKPSIHDVGERIRISRGINPDMMTEYAGIHDASAFPGDSDQEAEDFRKDAYDRLCAEISFGYAGLAATRAQAEEARRSLRLCKELVNACLALYANGKTDQSRVLQAQIACERQTETLIQLESREKLFSIRLNILTGDDPKAAIAPLEPLREYTPAFDGRALEDAYKSRRLLVLFLQVINSALTNPGGGALQALDSIGIEASAYVSASRVALDDLAQRIRRMRTVLIPRAELVYQAHLAAYVNGKANFMELFDALREVSAMRSEYQVMLGEIHTLKARLESATGIHLEEKEGSTK